MHVDQCTAQLHDETETNILLLFCAVCMWFGLSYNRYGQESGKRENEKRWDRYKKKKMDIRREGMDAATVSRRAG